MSRSTELVRGQTPAPDVSVRFISRRSQLDALGNKINDEWYYSGTPAAAEVRIRESQAGASAVFHLPVLRSRCIILPGGGDADCVDLPDEHISVQAAWTGSGDTNRQHVALKDRGLGYHDAGTKHEAWRSADVTATVSGDLHQQLADAHEAVLSRSATNASYWTRS